MDGCNRIYLWAEVELGFMDPNNRKFKALSNNFVISWSVKTMSAIIAGAAVGFMAAQLLFCAHSVPKELLGSILLGLTIGTFVGIAQYSQIREIIHNPKSWVVASAIGWGISAFLFEINWPISRCIRSSNAPGYTPGKLIEAIHQPIFAIATQTEKLVNGEIVYGGIYTATTVLLMSALIGITLGIPQGIGQWLVLRKHTHRSSALIWVNVIIWMLPYILVIVIVDSINFNQVLRLILIPCVLVIPAAITATMLLRLQKADEHEAFLIRSPKRQIKDIQ